MNILKEIILILIIILVITMVLGAQPLDATRQFGWTTPKGIPGNVTGQDGVVKINDGLLCAQYYVGVVQDLPFHSWPSAWYEIHVPFTEMTQESFNNMVYVEKDAALESVRAFEIDFHSKNDNEEGAIWIDDIAIYKNNPTGYREYITIGNYDELTAGGAWSGGRYYVYNDSGGTTPPAQVYGEVVAGGPSGTGNCLRVLYNLGGKHDDGSGNDVTSLGVGLGIIYGNPYTPAEVPMGTYSVADVRGFDGIRFWIKIQKCGVAWADHAGTIDLTDWDGGVGDEPYLIAGKNIGNYVIRCRLKSTYEVIGDPQYYNYFGLNIDY